jgi:hypothetical protein
MLSFPFEKTLGCVYSSPVETQTGKRIFDRILKKAFFLLINAVIREMSLINVKDKVPHTV